MLTKSCILIVDDDPDILKLLYLTLQKRGYYVVTVGRGIDAIKEVEKNKFNIILLDLKMPGLDGMDTYRRIRLLDSEVTVIIMTGYHDEDVLRQALKEGVFSVALKPLDIAKMVSLANLKLINVFYDMTSDEISEIANITTECKFSPKEVIFIPDDTADAVYFLTNGRVKLYQISSEGKEITLGILQPGDIFGEMETLGQSRREVFAEAMDTCYACKIDKKPFEKMLQEKPKVALKLIQVMARRFQQAQSKIEDMAFRDVTGRLSKLILKLAEEFGEQTSKGVKISVKLTHRDIGNMIGVSRETTTSTLNNFKKQKFIDFSRRYITVMDRKGLENLI
jgi:CRP/FNR family transcriptional regulator